MKKTILNVCDVSNQSQIALISSRPFRHSRNFALMILDTYKHDNEYRFLITVGPAF